MSCADDWWDAQTLDDPDDEPGDDIPEGPYLWLRRRWRPIEDLPDLATYQAAAELGAAFQQIAAAFVPIARALVEQVAQAYVALQGAGLLDAGGKPTRRRDRPAWQSPYGPPRTR